MEGRAVRNFLIVLLVALLVAVGFATCAEIKLAWNPNPPAECITDYRVWRGIDCIGTTSETQLPATLPDEPCAITITARNAAGESARSAALDLIVVFLEESLDLQTWKPLHSMHREMKDKAFYRIGFKGPAGRNIRITYQVEVMP